MTIPLTVIGPERSTDLMLPAHVPLAVLTPELAELLGHQMTRLVTVTGRALDPSLDLHDNGVVGGALLIAKARGEQERAVDDIVDLAAQHADAEDQRLDRGAVVLVLAVAALTVLAAWVRSPAPLAIASLVAALGLTALPRVALRMHRLDAFVNPAESGVNDRVRAARSMTVQVTRALAGCLLAGSVALAIQPSQLCVLAGWIGILAVALRASGRDRAVSIAVLAALCVLLVQGAGTGASGQLWMSIAGACAVGGVLCDGTRRPLLRVLQQATDRLVSILLPAALIAASGLLPGITV